MRSLAAGLTLVTAVGTLILSAPTVALADSACTPWSVRTIASGYSQLENLAFDGRGRMLLSETSLVGLGGLRTLTPTGERGTLVADVDAPGGIVVDGSSVYFATGDATIPGLLGQPTGTVQSVDLDSGQRSTVATGLVMPNGLARTDSGDLLTTRNLGSPQGLTLIPADGSVPRVVRTDLGSANGIAVDGDTVYVGTTTDPTITVHELQARNLTDPGSTIVVPGFGLLSAGDDLTVGPDGAVYQAMNLEGAVVRIDPSTGASCRIASGVPLTSSVRFGSGPGWNEKSLYATSFDGSVRELSPA